jgi:WD40 repeat protein
MQAKQLSHSRVWIGRYHVQLLMLGFSCVTLIISSYTMRAQEISIVEIARWGRGLIKSVAWSPDSDMIAVGNSDGITLYNSELGFMSHLTTCSSELLAWHPTGNLLAVACRAELQVWDVQMGNILASGIEIPKMEDKGALAWNSDSETLLYVNPKNGDITQWNLKSRRKIVAQYSGSKEIAERFVITSIGPNKQVVAVDHKSTIHIWDAMTGERITALIADEPTDLSSGAIFAWSSNGKMLASVILYVSEDISVWNTTTWQKTTGVEHRLLFGGMAWSPSSKTLVGALTPEWLYRWAMPSSELVSKPPLTKVYTDDYYIGDVALAFSPDGKTMLSSDETGLVLWDTAKWTVKKRIFDYIGAPTTMIWSPDGQYIISGHEDHSIRIWNVASSVPLRACYGHTATIRGLAFLSGKHQLISGAQDIISDDLLRFWNPDTCESLDELVAPTSFDTDLALHKQERWLALLAFDLLAVMDTTSRQILFYSKSLSAFTSATWCSDLLTVSDDTGLITIYDLTGKEIAQLSGHQGAVYKVACRPDGKVLASTGEDGTIRLWIIEDEGKNISLKGILYPKHGLQRSLAWHPNGKILVSASGYVDSYIKEHHSGGNDITFWDIGGETIPEKPLYTLTSNVAIGLLSWNPDGTLLVGGGKDNTIRIWNTKSITQANSS